MDEHMAWKYFEKTGSLEAYIRYAQFKDRYIPEGIDAVSNSRADNKGEHCR